MFTVFAALCTLMGAGVFSLLIPKAIDHFKDHNIRTIKDLEEIRKGEDLSETDKVRITKIMNLRKSAYLEKQEKLAEEFENTYRINTLEGSTNYENFAELHLRKLKAKEYDRNFNKNLGQLFLGIIAGSSVIVALAWMGANFIIQYF